jgi:hypothetical protein
MIGRKIGLVLLRSVARALGSRRNVTEDLMRRLLLAAAAAAALFAIAGPAQRAEAMPIAAPAQLEQGNAGLVQKAAIVCGYYGCRRVWGGYYGPRPYWGYYHRPYWHRRWHRW